MTTTAAKAVPLAEERGERASAVVRVEGAVRRYAGGRGAGPLDLEVLGGEVLALMGPNGAGKSTLLRVLASADRPARGRVIWWGSGKASRARRQIGYAGDEPVEEATLSTRQSTHFWCRQWVSDGPAARALTDQVLAELGLAGRADEPVGTLSYG
ncbi:MAG: ATP-binding cassette domain-containing protein, partial [Candidatus Dormiibacterota bacterium]